MVAPLIAVLGGVGLLGARSLISGRMEAKQLADMMAQQRETLDTLLGPTLAGNMGPQQQPALAGSLLTDAQVSTAQAMAHLRPKAAQDFVLQAGKNNRAAFVKDRQFGLDQSKFDQSITAFRANEKQRELENAVALRGRTTTENERLEGLAALDDRDLAERIAATPGPRQSKTIMVRNPDGGFVEVPVTGTAAHTKGVDSLRSTTKTLRAANDMVDIFRSGAIRDPGSPEGAAQLVTYQLALAGLRQDLGFGAPQKAELELLEKTFPDPSSLINGLIKGDPAAIRGWKVVQDAARIRHANVTRSTRFLRLDAADKQQAAIEDFRASEVPPAPTPEQQQFTPRSGLSSNIALRSAQIADALGFGEPGAVQLERAALEASQETGQPFLPGDFANVGRGALEGLEALTESVRIFR